MRQDLRHALRALRRRPIFALVAVLTLGAGIGATSAVFSVVHAVMLAPLPFDEPDRLVMIEQRREAEPGTIAELSYPDFRGWREQLRELDDVAAFAAGNGRRLEIDGVVERVPGKLVTWNFFDVLGVRPLLGRTFTAADGRPGAEPVAVLAEELWRTRLGADPDVIGRTIRLGSGPHTVVGIMPAAADYPVGDRVWSPAGAAIPPDALEDPGLGFLYPFGRLRDGATLESATAELDAYMDRVTNARTSEMSAIFARTYPFENAVLGDTRTPLLILFGATAILLLVACANVANLQLVRGMERNRESAIRVALGASTGRLIRLALAESGVLALAGAALGILAAALATGPILHATPVTLFRQSEVALNGTVLAFSVAAGLLAAILTGLGPAVFTAARSASAALRGGHRATRGGARRTLSGLVVAQVTLAVALLLAAGILVRSFAALYNVDTGFDRDGVVTLALSLSGSPEANEESDRFLTRLRPALEAIPGVEAAGGVLIRPLESRFGFDYPFSVEDRPGAEQANFPFVNYQAVTPGYFRAMGIELLAGRRLRQSDDEDAPPVAVVGASMARRFWSVEDAVGERIKWGAPDAEGSWITVIGVVEDARYREMDRGRLDVYVPYGQSPWPLGYLAIRAAGDPRGVIPAVRQAVRSIDPDVGVLDAATTGRLVSDALARPRFLAVLLGGFAGLALLLGSLGLYGVLAYAVTLRTRELGIRMALGATTGAVRGLVVGWGLRLAALGIVIGAALAFLGRGALADVAYGVGPADPATYAAVTALFLAVAAVASDLPARRASRTDPGLVLRSD